MLSEEIIQKLSVTRVNDPTIDPMNPVENGIYDLRLGSFEKSKICGSCNNNLYSCFGHYGRLQLNFPILHYGHFRTIINILSCICKSCGSLLLDAVNKRKYLVRFSKTELNSIQRTSFMKKLVEECKKIRYCPNCKCFQGIVKKMLGQNLKIVHCKWKNYNFSQKDQAKKQFTHNLEAEDIIELEELKIKNTDSWEELTPLRV